VGSRFNRVIELNEKMLILKRFVTKMIFFHVRIKKTEVEYLQKWRTPHYIFNISISFILDDIPHVSLEEFIFDCISFTECLITHLVTADSEAPASTKTFVTSVYPSSAALCRGVLL
jgi:hypothetical protein